VLILAAGGLEVVPDKAAILAATLAALVELAAAGAYAARRSGAGVRGTVVSAVTAVALGSAVVLLKAFVHYHDDADAEAIAGAKPGQRRRLNRPAVEHCCLEAQPAVRAGATRRAVAMERRRSQSCRGLSRR
jgi:hypothetical protein